MAATVYLLSALTMATCAAFLLIRYAAAGNRLLLWSGLCFGGLAASNVLVFIDLVMLPDVNLYDLRLGVALFGMILLLYGLIWDTR